jgi:hypothetical protein
MRLCIQHCLIVFIRDELKNERELNVSLLLVKLN